MWTWLRERLRLQRPARVVDPVLGVLTAFDGRWEGGGYFAPVRHEVEWAVDAGPDGPGEPQRAFFGALAGRYADVFPAILEVLLPHAAEWEDTPLDGSRLAALLTLTYFDVPAAETPSISWILTYDSGLRGCPCFDVRMRGWAPTGEVEVAR